MAQLKSITEEELTFLDETAQLATIKLIGVVDWSIPTKRKDDKIDVGEVAEEGYRIALALLQRRRMILKRVRLLKE